MFFQCIFTPGLAINSYVLGDEKSKKCVVIDPTRHVVPYIIQAQNAGLDIIAILETHVHADYVSGAKELKHQLNEKPQIYASGMGGEKWVPHYVDIIVEKRTQINCGDLRLEPLHTPGHTPEHLVWICYDESRSVTTPWFMFTGDCLFVGSVGRPDLLGDKEMGALAPQLYETLFEKLSHLPDFVEIFPTHGEGSLCGKSLRSRSTSTIGFERLFNPYLRKKALKQWIHDMKIGLSPLPNYFQRVKKINVEGPPLLSSLKVKNWDREKGADFTDIFLVDVRHPELFAVSHIQGSLNIPFLHSFCQWAGWMLPDEAPIGLIVEKGHIASEIVDQLRLMGFDQEITVIQWEEVQKNFSGPFSSLPLMEIEELAKKQSRFESLYILDVRTMEEWRTGYIQGSHHLELNLLEKELKLLPHHQTIALLCRSGQRGSLAASLLQKHGFPSVFNIRGGIQAWKQAGFETVLIK